MQNAKDAMVNMREEVNMQANNYQSHVEAARVAELEAAQAAAQAALMAEMELLRRQKHGAEQQARDLEDQASLECTPLASLVEIERLAQQHTEPV
jgi:K+/H+ antiporter YhaU regulatory subunit KhtT